MYELLKRLSSRKDHMKAVGQGAMDEIYVSWETSVLDAFEHYNIIIENKKAGLYNTKRHKAAGKVLELTDDLFYEMHEMFRKPLKYIDSMLDNAMR